MQRDFRGQLYFVVSAEPLSPSCFPDLLLTNDLRSGCDSRAEFFALSICQPGCQGSAISPCYNSVTFTIKPTGSTSLLGSASVNWGWNPPLMSVCAPSITAFSLLWGLGPILPPHSPQSHLNRTLGSVSFCSESVGGVSSALPLPFPTGCEPGPAGRKSQDPVALLWGLRCHRCHREPPETRRVLPQLSWLELVLCTQNQLK